MDINDDTTSDEPCRHFVNWVWKAKNVLHLLTTFYSFLLMIILTQKVNKSKHQVFALDPHAPHRYHINQ